MSENYFQLMTPPRGTICTLNYEPRRGEKVTGNRPWLSTIRHTVKHKSLEKKKKTSELT